MHILFLTDNFPPEVNAPASRTFEHAQEWVRQGHRVTVVTCAPNFPAGKVMEGYRNQPWQREEMGGVDVIRVWTFIAPNVGVVKRILDYQSFMVSATLACPFVQNVDVVVGTSPQFFTAWAAYAVSKYKRVPFVFELRDHATASIKAVGAIENSGITGALDRAEIFLYRNAARIVVVTHSFKRELEARGIDGAKIDVVTNGVDTTRFHPMAKDASLTQELGLEGKFVAGYIGTHGMAHALDVLLDAAEMLRGEPVAFLMLGDGARKAELIKDAERRGLNNVTFVDTVSKSEVPRYWSVLDATVVNLKKTELFKSVIPSKIFEAMGMAIPILLGVAGESADIVTRAGAGLTYEPENAGQLAACVRQLMADNGLAGAMAQAGPRAAAGYDRRVLAGDMLNSLEAAARSTPTRSLSPTASSERAPRVRPG